MGGGEHGHGVQDFRAKVWSMSGGPYCRPKHWRRNTAIAMFGVFLICIPIAMKSAELEIAGICWARCLLVDQRVYPARPLRSSNDRRLGEVSTSNDLISLSVRFLHSFGARTSETKIIEVCLGLLMEYRWHIRAAYDLYLRPFHRFSFLRDQ
ncbi:hypothetical protein PVK06_028000 [Gossypium arboreum]|uniref:Uncharacterized protein n=1 Tax=Gossypium arboreum TaxID=29729 RepID=A0ABR0P1W0_GOSAR|nr:hypothetical protein PVK06_028000 [Gossypium arboreum]